MSGIGFGKNDKADTKKILKAKKLLEKFNTLQADDYVDYEPEDRWMQYDDAIGNLWVSLRIFVRTVEKKKV